MVCGCLGRGWRGGSSVLDEREEEEGGEGWGYDDSGLLLETFSDQWSACFFMLLSEGCFACCDMVMRGLVYMSVTVFLGKILFFF